MKYDGLCHSFKKIKISNNYPIYIDVSSCDLYTDFNHPLFDGMNESVLVGLIAHLDCDYKNQYYITQGISFSKYGN